MDIDPLMLSRIQFAFTISFHILFPAFTIGLAAWIMVLEACGCDRPGVYRVLSEFWTRIFAISFGMGVVSGHRHVVPVRHQLEPLSDIAGNVLGPLINYEVVTAFFLEATFLGILLFGRERVPPGMHFVAACMVAIGTLISAFWILAANSWMQTPAGFEIRDGTFFVDELVGRGLQPVLPLPPRAHGDRDLPDHRLRGRGHQRLAPAQAPCCRHAGIGFSMAMGLITVLAPLQILLGDLHGLNTLHHQPAKIAAMEGHWQPGPARP